MKRLRALHNQQETAADAPPRTELTLWHRAVALQQSVRQAVVCWLLLEPHRSTHHKERERKRKKERERERETALPSEHTFFSAHNLHRVVHGNRVRFFGPQSPSGSPRTSCTFSSWMPLGQAQLDWNSAQSVNPLHLW